MSNVFNTPPPKFNEAQVVEILSEHYGINGSIKELISDRDQNFKIITKDQSYVLKIANSAESKDILDMQNLALNHIINKDSSLDIPYPIKSINDEEIIYTENMDCGYYLRLLSYVEGKFLNEIKPNNNLLFSLGRFLGYLDQLLEDFNHNATDRKFIWDAKQIDVLSQQLKLSEDDAPLISYYIDLFNEHIIGQVDALGKTVIHNDGNDHNVIIGHDEKIKSIIDFGDMIYSYKALEPAVCMAYIAMENQEPFPLIAPLLKGYHSTNPLSVFELESVVYLMCLRMCITINMSIYRKQLFPENRYISISEDNARKFLENMRSQNIQKWSKDLTEYAKS